MFDGSRSSCAWGRDDDGTPDGIFGGANAPSMLRSDYVANSNDGYWITNARQPLVGPTPFGYSPLYGPVGVAQHLRTRSGFIGIEDMLAQRGRVGPQDLQALMFSNRVLAAELVLPELLPACMAGADALLLKACTALAQWDRKSELDSRGAVLFREFWNSAAKLPGIWSLAFDVADPLHSPRGLAPAAIPAMLAALKDAALRLQQLGVPFDGRLAEFQAGTAQWPALPYSRCDWRYRWQLQLDPYGRRAGSIGLRTRYLGHQLYPPGQLRRKRAAGARPAGVWTVDRSALGALCRPVAAVRGKAPAITALYRSRHCRRSVAPV